MFDKMTVKSMTGMRQKKANPPYEYYLGLRLSEKERNIILKTKKQLEERDKREYSISETVRNILLEFSKYG